MPGPRDKFEVQGMRLPQDLEREYREFLECTYYLPGRAARSVFEICSMLDGLFLKVHLYHDYH